MATHQVLDEKIKVLYRPKNLSQPEFSINLSIELPEMPKDAIARYKKEFDTIFAKKYKAMRTDFFSKYNGGIKHLDDKISDRLKKIADINKRLGSKKVISGKGGQQLAKDIEEVTRLAREDKQVLDAYEPVLRNAVMTFESQVRAEAENIQSEIEERWDKASADKRKKQKKKARRNTAIKIGMVVGLVLVGAALTVAVLATGGAAMAPVALGLGILAAVVGTASGIASGVKAYNQMKDSLKNEKGKLEEHLGKFEKAFEAYESMEAGKAKKDLGLNLATKSKGKSEAKRKSALASLDKVHKHADRVAALSLKMRTQARDDKRKVADMRASAEKAKADFDRAQSTLKKMKLENAHAETNDKLLKASAGLEKELSAVEDKAAEVAKLLTAVTELESDLKSGKRKKADITARQKKVWRFVYFIPDLLSHTNSATSAMSGTASAATA